MDGVTDSEVGDIDGNDFREIFWETLDIYGVHIDLENSAVIFNAAWFADGFHGNAGVKFFVFFDRMKIYVKNFLGNGVVLDLLNQGEAISWAGRGLDRQIDKHVFAGGLTEQFSDFAGIDREVNGFDVTAVDDSGNESLSLDFFDGSTAGGEARLRVEGEMFCHRMFRLFRFR